MRPSSDRALFVLTLLGLGAISACKSASVSEAEPAARWRYTPDLAVSQPPYRTVHANYKERLDQAYVFLECRGTYTATGRLFEPLHAALQAASISAAGPPFALFYDDPGRVAVSELRSRACFPVEGPLPANGAWQYDVLPGTTVVYAVIGGPYPDVPRAYPGIFAFMTKMGWVENGPIREIYLVPPSVVTSNDQLMCEVQIPATNAP